MKKMMATVTVIRRYQIVSDVEVEVEVPDDISDDDLEMAFHSAAKDAAVELTVEDENDAYTPDKVEIEEVTCIDKANDTPACSNCGSSDDVESTGCGSMCPDCADVPRLCI